MDKSIQIWNWYWWSHRFALLFLLASVLIAQLLFWLVTFASWSNGQVTGAVLLILSMLTSSLISISVFSSGNNLDLTLGQSAFPRWLALLPVSNRFLATIPILGMALALAWSWIPFALAIRKMFPELTYSDFVFLPLGLILAIASWIQVLSWRPFRTGWHRLGALLLLSLTFIFLIMIGGLFAFWLKYIAVGVMLILGVLAAYGSVGKARVQEDVGLTRLATSTSSYESSSASPSELLNRNELASYQSSLLWRDWHQIARIVAGIMTFLSVGILLLVLLDQAAVQLVVLFPFVATLLMSAVGINFGKDAYFKPKSELPIYLSALPVSDRDFLLSRLKTVLMTSMVVWLLSLVPLLVWLVLPGNPSELKTVAAHWQALLGMQSVQEWRTLIVLLVLSGYSAIVCPFPAMALGFFGRPRLEMTVTCVVGISGFSFVLFACYGFVQLTNRAEANPQRMVEVRQWLTGLIPYLLVCVIVLKLIFFGFVFRLANRRGISQTVFVRKQMIVMFSICLVLTALIFFAVPASNSLKAYAAMMTVALFPMGSIHLGGYALDCNRHR